jgi:alkylation response protein AidB-like acyl-CoA dehydrogenase
VLDGAKCNVWLHADTEALLVTAVTDEAAHDEVLLEVPRNAPGLALREFATVDDGRAVDAAFNGVRVETACALAGAGGGFAASRLRAWDLVLLAEAAECLGLMKALLQRTSEYLAARKQFGQPLSKLQVLRHRLADMALARFRAEALVAFAAREFEGLGPGDRSRLVAAALSKALVGARFVAEQAVQLHGGMGVSEDLPVGRHLRRVLALEATLGTPDFHRGRFADGASG